ncbi:MAG TPA: alpha/beta-hydrolase N-terminal domain-containing protein, partial [Mycobacterium sp.]
MPQPVQVTAEIEPARPQVAGKPWWVRHYTFTGTAGGLLFIWLSMTPSLLPRGPLYQGLVTGCCGAIGYGLGVFTVWLVRYMRSKDSSPPPPRWAWYVLIAVGAVGHLLMIFWVHSWQNQLRDLIEVPRLAWYNYPQGGLLAIVVLFVLVEVGQLIRRLARFLVRQLDRIAPQRVSAVVVALLLVTLAVAVLNGVVATGAMRVLNRTFAAVNEKIDPDNQRPSTPLRSGGPHSLVSWMSLGHQGRVFVSSGPTMAQLTAFNHAPATEPIRAYAGLDSIAGIRPSAELAALELQRTGAFNRAVIAVATTTGTGWLNEAEASALEYMYNGNTAIVSMQYSFLPSWLSFLVDKENARHAGQA